MKVERNKKVFVDLLVNVGKDLQAFPQFIFYGDPSPEHNNLAFLIEFTMNNRDTIKR